MTATACRSLAAKNLQRSIWRGSRSSVPFWLEPLAGLLAWCARKLSDPPRRTFRTCAFPRCNRVFYGVSELCRSCREMVQGRGKS